MSERHGFRYHHLYKVWQNIKTRCYNPNVWNFKYYGARNIIICPEWKDSPKMFVEWGLRNGWQKGLQIDRIDNDGNYCPENCRFVTRSENMSNTGYQLKSKSNRISLLPIGVSYNPKKKRYQVFVTRMGESIHIGSYTNVEEASKDYQMTKKLIKSRHFKYIIYLTLLQLLKNPKLADYINIPNKSSHKTNALLPTGVTSITDGTYISKIKINNEAIYLGEYSTSEEAEKHYKFAKSIVNGTSDENKKYLYYSCLLKLNQNPDKYKEYLID